VAQDFVERVRCEQVPVVSGQDARAALEIALAATESYYVARPVELPLAG
jgi:predicted dehydrogenase